MSHVIPPNRFDRLTVDGITTERTAAFFEQIADDLNGLVGAEEIYSSGSFSEAYADSIARRVSDLEYMVSDQSSVDFLVKKIDALEKEIAFIERNPRELVRGTIVLWWGATADIPNGWVICNGSNGTPDLRNNFVVGAGSTYAVDDTGGSATYDFDVTSTSTVATNQNTTSTMGGPGSTTEVQSGTGVTVASNIHDHVMNAHTHTQNTHTHDVTDTIDTLPPYYALAYIMKV